MGGTNPYDSRGTERSYLPELDLELRLSRRSSRARRRSVPSALQRPQRRGIRFLGIALERFWLWHSARFRVRIYRAKTRRRTFRAKGLGPTQPRAEHDLFLLRGHRRAAGAHRAYLFALLDGVVRRN